MNKGLLKLFSWVKGGIGLLRVTRDIPIATHEEEIRGRLLTEIDH